MWPSLALSNNSTILTNVTASNDLLIENEINKSSSNKQLIASSFNISATQSAASGTNHSLFKDVNNSNKILFELNQLRQSNSLCDVYILCDGHEFNCHKVRFEYFFFLLYKDLFKVCIGVIK